MSLDPFRSRPIARHTPFAPSRRLERTVVLIGWVIATAAFALFRLSVGGGLFASWWTLALVEGALVAAVLGLCAFASFLARRGVG